MKQRKKRKPYQERFDSDDMMSVGELSHHIGKKMTEKVQRSSKGFKRNPKHRKDWHDDE